MTKRIHYLDLLALAREAAAAGLAMGLLTHESRTATSHTDKGVLYTRGYFGMVTCWMRRAATFRRSKAAGSNGLQPITYVMSKPPGFKNKLSHNDRILNWTRSYQARILII